MPSSSLVIREAGAWEPANPAFGAPRCLASGSPEKMKGCSTERITGMCHKTNLLQTVVKNETG
ncbi:MAG: hypothetical protein GY862_03720, partial [Gammaproteobacteria bacterium]|nr:hypothetical protein [Gammaproteobacteria bacterium]